MAFLANACQQTRVLARVLAGSQQEPKQEPADTRAHAHVRTHACAKENTMESSDVALASVHDFPDVPMRTGTT